MKNVKTVVYIVYDKSKIYLNDLVRVSVSWGFILLLSQIVGIAPAQAPGINKAQIDSCKTQYKRIESKLDFIINNSKK